MAKPDVTLCISLCETTSPNATADDLAEILAHTCWEAGFPGCERVYAGSCFCENYFLALPDAFHVAVRDLCIQHEMGATLVVPIAGQAFLDRVERRIESLLSDFGDLYDEVVVNDVAAFMWLVERTDKRIGLGRLFSKGLRDARYPEVFDSISRPEFSPEALACLQASPHGASLVEVDPTSAVVDASAFEGVEVAIHLPFCYATTGRNCAPASYDVPDSEKFRLGRGCALQCLRMVQGSRTDQGVRYIKHGRTHYYENPDCQIAGTDHWRIVYAASNETMR